MEEPVDELVLQVLDKANCKQVSNFFKGVKKSEFLNYSLTDVLEKLSSLKHGKDLAASKIFVALQDFRNVSQGSLSNGSDNLTNRNGAISSNEVSVKQEDSESVSDDEDEVIPLPKVEPVEKKPIAKIELDSDSEDEKPSVNIKDEPGTSAAASASPPSTATSGNGATVKQESSDDDSSSEENVKPIVEPVQRAPVDEVMLESSSDEETPAETVPVGESSLNSRPKRNRKQIMNMQDIMEIERSDDSGEECSPRKRKPKTKRDTNFEEGLLELQDPAEASKQLKKYGDILDRVKLQPKDNWARHNCDIHDATLDREIGAWEQFYRVGGPKIRNLDLHCWSWRKQSSQCPYNLARLLTKLCPKLEEVCIKAALAVESLDENYVLPSSTKFKKLISLVVHHEGKLNYLDQLESIMLAMTRMERFEYWFDEIQELNDVLEVLGRCNVSNLKRLVVRSKNNVEYVRKEQLESITKLDAPKLESLEIGNGFWEDCKPSVVQNLMGKFKNLKSFTMYGNYIGDSLVKPDIVINVPPLAFLEVLSLGGNYEFDSVDETSKTPSNGPGNVITVSEELSSELFSVSVKLPLLPRLEKIVLGNLYKIEELHFGSLKSLKTFQVGSPWHLSVKFPEEASRNSSYPSVEELQVPDCLKDPSFVQALPTRFPNLKKCWIYLPTMLVLRKFLEVMQKSSLESLYIKTQFDFPSALDTCLAPKKKLLVPDRNTGYSDQILIEYLEEYEESKRAEFITFHNIEMPLSRKQIHDLEDDPNYWGFRSLEKLRFLHLEHVPRRLRIPMGDKHWTHHQAQFTDLFIGYMSYPITDLALKCIGQERLVTCRYPNFNVFTCNKNALAGAGYTVARGKNAGDDAEVVECGRASLVLPTTVKTAAGRSDQKAKKKINNNKVQIRPAMLQATFKFKEKEEKD